MTPIEIIACVGWLFALGAAFYLWGICQALKDSAKFTDTLLTDEKYVGGVRYWVAQHDALLIEHARLMAWVEKTGDEHDFCTWDAHPDRLCASCNCHRKPR